MFQVVILALLLITGGCAGSLGLPSPEASKAIASAKTVGIISAVGHKFALQKIGITVFGNELNEVPVNSWGIDDAVASRVSALLSPRFTVKRISHPPRELDEGLEDALRKVAATQKYDLYLVIVRTGVPFSNTNQIVSGLGMVEAGAVLNPDNIHLFAITVVHVYDGRTLERLAWQRAEFQIGASLIGRVINGPYRKLDRTWWPATPQAVHNDRLKSATRALVEQSLATTVPEVMGIKSAERARQKGEP